MDKRFKQIALASFLVAGLGLLVELSHFVAFAPDAHILRRCIAFFGYYVYLDISPEISWFRYSNHTTGYSVNFLNVAFYVIMLSGACFYYFSQQRETRLIRFSFAVILVVQIVGLFSGVLSVISFFQEYYMKHPMNFLFYILATVKDVGVIILSVWVLKEMRKSKTLSFSANEAGENILHSASRWERFFHHVFDYLLCVLIFSFVHYQLTTQIDFFRGLQNDLDFAFFSLMSIVYRLIYYVISEGILSASPAKFLTESRAVTFEGKNIELHHAITRTGIRFVPFEPFSFFGKSGWHDQWSTTDVVKEARTGVAGSLYFIILPILLLFGVGGYFGIEWYEDHQQYVAEKEVYDAQVAEYSFELDHLTTSHFVELEDALEPYASEKTFLKIDSIYDGKVDVWVFTGSDESPMSVVEMYRAHAGAAQKQTIEISTLKKGLADDFDAFKEDQIKGEAVLEGTKRYWIDNVFAEGAPVLKTSSTGYHNGSGYNLEVENCGWSATLVEVRTIKGDIRFGNELPDQLPGLDAGSYGCGTLSLQGIEEQPGSYFVIELVVRDQHERRSVYIMEGAALTRTLKRKM